ncbi:hypothetical protein [Thiomicrorhabdus heinhorstiae]|uniref:PE-PGRS family protein n=2 Tax=Thiomicrorhabdus TaxID=2039723 RepID=A0ABS0BV27_9GAMM|nr:hypothetical protein [Thiomicrorhabdus heinhorstiae]MBF6057690.1 hypothetical protein [Thiomicrorhabdus heinhorstiae]
MAATMNLLSELPLLGPDNAKLLVGGSSMLPYLGEDAQFLTATLHAALPGASIIQPIADKLAASPIIQELNTAVEPFMGTGTVTDLREVGYNIPVIGAGIEPMITTLSSIPVVGEFVDAGLMFGDMLHLGGGLLQGDGVAGTFTLLDSIPVVSDVSALIVKPLIGELRDASPLITELTDYLHETIPAGNLLTEISYIVDGIFDGGSIPILGSLPVVGALFAEDGLVGGLLGNLPIVGDLLGGGSLLAGLPVVGDFLGNDNGSLLIGLPVVGDLLGSLGDLPIVGDILGTTGIVHQIAGVDGLLGAEGLAGQLVGVVLGDEGVLTQLLGESGLGGALLGDGSPLGGLPIVGELIDNGANALDIQDLLADDGLIGGLLNTLLGIDPNGAEGSASADASAGDSGASASASSSGDAGLLGILAPVTGLLDGLLG